MLINVLDCVSTLGRKTARLVAVAFIQMKLFVLSRATCSTKHPDSKETQIVIACQTKRHVCISTHRRMPQSVDNVQIFAYIQSSRS